MSVRISRNALAFHWFCFGFLPYASQLKTDMRLIGELDDASKAEKFASYLITQEIDVKVDNLDSGVSEIWIKDEDHFETAKAELESFKGDSGNKKYSGAVHEAAKIVRQKEKKRRAIQKKIVKVGARSAQPKPRFTIALIVISGVIALLTDFGDSMDREDPKIFKALEFVSIPPDAVGEVLNKADGDIDSLHLRLASIKRGEIWRMVTPIFIHHGAMHILFNMLWLFQLGRVIENRYGWKSLLGIVLVSAAISNLVQCTVPVAWDGTSPFILPDGHLLTGLGGMSGVVYGLFGFVWMRATFDRTSGFFMPQSTLVIMLGWMFFCMVPTLSNSIGMGGVANWAHAVGCLVGMAIGYWPVLFRR